MENERPKERTNTPRRITAPNGAGHRKRLRERFLSGGLEGFCDHEVIELLLTLATPRKDCKPAAKAALARFETLSAVLAASPGELCRVPGIGPKNLLGLKLVPAVAQRCLEEGLVGKKAVNNSRELFEYLTMTMRDEGRECFQAIYLDAKNRVKAMETLFRGSLTASSVYPREVVQAALDRKAAALIFAHNHPSGDPSPSREDMAITRRLIEACGVVGITVHEHLIIGHNRYYSFADEGHIARMRGDISAKEQE